jgi:hypothetical protein
MEFLDAGELAAANRASASGSLPRLSSSPPRMLIVPRGSGWVSPSTGDFERQDRAVEIGGFVEPGLPVAEPGQLRTQVDDGFVGASRGGLQQGERFTIELLRAG